MLALDALILVGQSGWDHDHMDLGDGGWLVMWIGMIVFWVLVVVAVVWLVREVVGPRRRTSSTDALEILDRRLAEGEISPEEYQERRGLLKS